MSITKKCAPKLIFFNEKKKNEKIAMIFESQILALIDTSTLTQFSIFNNFL